MEKLIKEYERKIERLELGAQKDIKRNVPELAATKQMIADNLKVFIHDIRRVLAERPTENSGLNIADVSVPKGTVCKKCNGTGELPRQKGDLITRHCDC